jgi:Hemerythrin HHE cation binding domain
MSSAWTLRPSSAASPGGGKDTAPLATVFENVASSGRAIRRQRTCYVPVRRCWTMKATDLLKKQHKEVKALFKKIEGTDNARQRRQLMTEIATALEGHTTIEEEMFYPAVRGLETQKAEEMVLEAYEEHAVVKLVLAELPNVNPEDERFEAKMTVLSELVVHHADEEEKEMFKLAQKLGKDELESLGEQMEERFEQLRSRKTREAA